MCIFFLSCLRRNEVINSLIIELYLSHLIEATVLMESIKELLTTPGYLVEIFIRHLYYSSVCVQTQKNRIEADIYEQIKSNSVPGS